MVSNGIVLTHSTDSRSPQDLQFIQNNLRDLIKIYPLISIGVIFFSHDIPVYIFKTLPFGVVVLKNKRNLIHAMDDNTLLTKH